eukprot:11913960-Alexandrium_andersonii.AAC.1
MCIRDSIKAGGRALQANCSFGGGGQPGRGKGGDGGEEAGPTGSQSSQGDQQNRRAVCWDMRDKGTCPRGDS